MIESWRIVKAEHSADAFSGEGAMLYAGRWHSEGTRVVYTSESISLATLEILVHLRRPKVAGFVVLPCHFPERLVEDLDVAFLPDDWSAPIAPPALRRFGDAWARERISAVLRVPSAVTLLEFNYLLNPDHPDFRSIELGEPRPFKLDYRLVT